MSREPAGNHIAIIGLGIMGGAIARNLIAGGFPVQGYDVDKARCAALQQSGGAAADNVAAVAHSSDIVLTCLPHAQALDDTVAALIAAPTRPSVVAELSTLAIADKTRARDMLAAAGITLLDCPLSGTGAQAQTGDLSVFASGARDVVERYRAVFQAFARVVHYVGPFGNGMKMKLVANLLVAIHNVAAAEAILLGLRSGLDPATLVEIAGSGAGASRMLQLRGPMMVADSFLPATMKLDVWQKDMQLIADFARETGIAVPAFEATVPLYGAALAEGLGDADTAAVFKVLEGLSRGS